MTPRIPVRFEWEGGVARVRWFHTDGLPFHEPFHDDSLSGLRRLLENTGGGVLTGIERLEQHIPITDPTAIVFHTSRCGSTLVSRAMATLPGSRVLSEPRIADDILRAQRAHRGATNAERERWLRAAFAALSASRPKPPTRTVVKLDCWHIFELERVRASFPRSPLLFLYRDPMEVLVSLHRRPSLTLVRDTVLPDQLGLTPRERDALTQMELAAAILGAFFRVATHHRRTLLPVPYTSLPGFLWDGMPGGPWSPEEEALLRNAAMMSAKDPSIPFTLDSESKRAAVTREIRAAHARWVAEPYRLWLDAV